MELIVTSDSLEVVRKLSELNPDNITGTQGFPLEIGGESTTWYNGP